VEEEKITKEEEDKRMEERICVSLQRQQDRGDG